MWILRMRGTICCDSLIPLQKACLEDKQLSEESLEHLGLAMAEISLTLDFSDIWGNKFPFLLRPVGVWFLLLITRVLMRRKSSKFKWNDLDTHIHFSALYMFVTTGVKCSLFLEVWVVFISTKGPQHSKSKFCQLCLKSTSFYSFWAPGNMVAATS